ncbi:protein kinase domain-containing protein [Paludisphaera mucosa]|uniref:Protein kinase n=1 Tax=Paludisphaera mucosa TaxID=3030827 RepID=A0ABT6FDV5_9BACT|nr:protein kinase [Paludisphaera mucosa]MDG3005765.1 protein kinase [Paludisphaera mucosa]
MSEREPTLEKPGQAEGRAACSNCLRVLVFSGEPPRFCGYCGAPLGPDSVADTDSGPTRTIVPGDETTDYDPTTRRPADAADGPFPERVAGYRLIRRLGSGGMGTVFEAVEERQGLHVALKLIAPRNLSSEEALQRFRQEGRSASAVTHPRCVFVRAVDEDQGRPYLAMELMPGTTLQSLVDDGGPLEAAEAILKILDVMEGLAEFHKLGMIHRDVKPSNCFLDEDGRVKIGDFGLSKSLEGGADLTRTGAFLGTPLYASPEQIKREPLDERTDVYSIAATLYFLLTGRAPVQAEDAAEALARIVSEPAPPLRTFAPRVSRTLEVVIHRGLERDRSRRWRDLREFHEALLPFVPERVDIGSIGLRIGAYVLDLALFYIAVWAAFAASFLQHRGRVLETLAFNERHGRVIELIDAGVWIAYFAILEGLFGASVGKWIVGLRVAKAGDGEPPGLPRALARSLAFVLLFGLGTEVYDALYPPDPRANHKVQAVLLAAMNLVGFLILIAPMRQHSGFRGVHEWISGTRVIQVVRARRHRRLRGRRGLASGVQTRSIAADEGHPTAQVGPYRIQGAVSSAEGCEVLAGRDESLDRQAWLFLRDPGAVPPDDARRSLSRLTRPRWIGGGDQPDARWDAFIAPTGRRLRGLVETGGLPWRDVLPILTDLAEELEAARVDGTFPARLDVDDVWIQDDERVQLVDPLAWGRPDEAEPSPETGPGAGEETRAFAFLRDVARLALEGDRPHRRLSLTAWAQRDEPSGRIRGAVPERAGVLLDRLSGHRSPYAHLAHLRSDLAAAAERPTEVGAGRRALQLLIQGFLLSPGMLFLVGLSCPELGPDVIPFDLPILAGIPLAWVVWAVLARGGFGYTLAGLTLVGDDGRIACRFACGLRSLLVWVVPATLFVGSRWLQRYTPEYMVTAWALWMAGLLLLAAYVGVALLFPGRGPHDRIVDTVVVPI